MSRINVANFRHPDATADSITVTSDGDTQINRALGLGGATYGTSGQVLTSAGSGAAPTWAAATNLTRGTAAATTSGTSVDFTSLPAGIRKITLVVDQISSSLTDNFAVRFSTGGTFATSGYISSSARVQDAAATSIGSLTTGFIIINNDNSSRQWNGSFTWHNITGNTWIMSGNANHESNNRSVISAGTFTLGGTLDGIRLYATASNAFDNGQVNIFYEV